MDLAVANEGSGTVTIATNDGLGRFAATATLEAGDEPWAVIAHDFDGDGDLDLATANSETDDISILFNRHRP